MALSIDALKLKVADLQVAIENKQPNYSGLLQLIHKNMGEQPELCYKLADEEIAVVIKGLETLQKIEITDPKMKKPLSKKQGNLLSAEDV
jgi:hypothetical protein